MRRCGRRRLGYISWCEAGTGRIPRICVVTTRVGRFAVVFILDPRDILDEDVHVEDGYIVLEVSSNDEVLLTLSFVVGCYLYPAHHFLQGE